MTATLNGRKVSIAMLLMATLLFCQLAIIQAAPPSPTTSTINWQIQPSLVPVGPGRTGSGNTLTVCARDWVKFVWTSEHGVVQAKSVAGYNSCSLTPGSYMQKSPVKERGTVTIKYPKAGTRYYFCQYSTHCSMGMKVTVVVKKC